MPWAHSQVGPASRPGPGHRNSTRPPRAGSVPRDQPARVVVLPAALAADQGHQLRPRAPPPGSPRGGPGGRRRTRPRPSSVSKHELLPEIGVDHTAGGSAAHLLRAVPSAIFSPWWSTTIRCARRIMAAMMCSITIRPRAVSLQAAQGSRSFSTSFGGVEPRHDLVEQQEAGLRGEGAGPPRAALRRTDGQRAGARLSAEGPRAGTSRSPRRAASRAALTAWNAGERPESSRLSSTERLPKGFTSWKVRVRPSAHTWVGREGR